MKILKRISRKVGSSVETLILFDDWDKKEKTCQRRNLREIGNYCVEANPLNCEYWRRGTGECGLRMCPEMYETVPIELIQDLRNLK